MTYLQRCDPQNFVRGYTYNNIPDTITTKLLIMCVARSLNLVDQSHCIYKNTTILFFPLKSLRQNARRRSGSRIFAKFVMERQVFKFFYKSEQPLIIRQLLAYLLHKFNNTPTGSTSEPVASQLTN